MWDINIVMLLGLLSVALITVGIYFLVTDENTMNQQIKGAKERVEQAKHFFQENWSNTTESNTVDQEIECNSISAEFEAESGSESESSELEISRQRRPFSMPDLTNLWDSYNLEEKYNELIKAGVPFLDQNEWKQRVRQKVNSILNDEDFQKDSVEYIAEQRSSRPPGRYAVVEDTALTLAEYYQNQRQISAGICC